MTTRRCGDARPAGGFRPLNAGPMRFSVGAVNVAHRKISSYFENADTTQIGPSISWPAVRCRRAFRRPRSMASITGTAGSFPIRRCNGCSTAGRGGTRWRSRSTCGIRAARCRKDLIEVEVRQKEIVYSSRTRAATDQYKKAQKLRIAVANLLKELPKEIRSSEDAKLLEREADDRVCNIVHLIYRAQRVRRHSQGLRVFPAHDGRALEERLRTTRGKRSRTPK